MALRITESRIPAGFTPNDLGQATVSSCGNYSLISSFTSPLHVSTNNPDLVTNNVEYYVFVVNEDIGKKYDLNKYKFKWDISFIDSDGTSNVIRKDKSSKDDGFANVYIDKTGKLVVVVTVLYDNSSKAELRLEQNVIELDKTLEDLYLGIGYSSNINKGTLAGNIDTSREILNDLYSYIVLATPPASINNNSTSNITNIPSELLTAIIYVLIFAFSDNAKNLRTNAFEAIINNINQNLFDEDHLKLPLGVCRLSPQFVSNALNKYKSLLSNTDEAIKQRCDLINLLRFPKTNIQLCSEILANIKKISKYKELTKEQLLNNVDALKYICEEFFKGLLNSSNSATLDENPEEAKKLPTNAVNILSYPFIPILNREPILGFETYKVLVLDCRSGQPVKNGKVKRIKIGTVDTMFKIDESGPVEGDSILSSQKALRGFYEEYVIKENANNDNNTIQLRFKYDCGEPGNNYGSQERAAYSKYWIERGCPYLSLNTISGGNPAGSFYKLIIEEYNSHRATDSNGYLNIKIPRVLLLTQEKITIEVGFHDFPVVLEAQNNDSRSNPIKRSSQALIETGFAISWEGCQGTEWGNSFGWKVRNDSKKCESVLKVSEKFDVRVNIADDGKISFKDEHTNIYFDSQNSTSKENPHAVLFAMQWCQPVWDKIKDADSNERVNEISFVTKKDDEDNWIKDLNMHIVSRYISGDANPYGHYYGFFDITAPTHRRYENGKNKPHQGIDLFTGSDGNIECFATHAGLVQIVDSTTYGKSILLRIKSKNNHYFRYAHLSETNDISTNDYVMCGKNIAKTGRTKIPKEVYPSHLHFELLKGSEERFEPNDIKIIGNDLIDSINAKIMPSNKLPLILPCKCAFHIQNQNVSNCKFTDNDVLKTCWAVQEFPYDEDTLDYSSNDKSPESTTTNNNRDHQSIPFIDNNGLRQFVCPYIFKTG